VTARRQNPRDREISFAEVVRLVALNSVELTQGPLALTNIPSIAIGLPDIGSLTLRTKAAELLSRAISRGGGLRADLAPRAFAFRPLDARV